MKSSTSILWALVLAAPSFSQRAAVQPGAIETPVLWSELGPAPIASGPYTGRVAALACSRTDPNRYYVGGADGGVWRTDDGGASWIAVGDSMPTTAIGALAIDPNDDNVIYAGTGEANFANHSRYGVGFARSRDGGRTWRMFGEAAFAGRTFSRLAVDPQDPATIYASTSHAGGFPARVAARNHPLANGPIGIFKSTDFGETWSQLSSGIPTDLSATDVVLDSGSPTTVYAAIGDIFGDSRNGVYRSTDGGASFTKLGGGLPTSNVGRIALAVAPSQPNLVVASVVNSSDSSGGGASTRNAYRSTNGGNSWSTINPGSLHATYGWFLCTSVIDPTNPSNILLGGFDLRRTTNGGNNWSTVTPPHVDLHALEFDAAGRLLCGNDGGVHRSTNLGSSWQSINNNLGLVQFYAGVSLHPNFGIHVYGGAQDNGSLFRTGNNNDWTSVLGGDGGYTSIDSTGTRVFVEFQGTGNLYRSLNGGSFQFSGSGIFGDNCFLPPHDIHPSDSLLMIYGTERLWKSTNGGSSWSAVGPDLTGGGSAAISGLGWAPSDPGTIYALTNDGRVQVTSNGGNNWNLRLTGVPTWPRTRRPFAVHPTDPERALMAVAAFGTDQILATENRGQSWHSIDGNLPDIPANAIAMHLQEGGPPVIYLGTDQGVWRSDDSGVAWRRYGNLPNAPVIDLRVDVANDRVVAATQGRGLWSAPLSPRRVVPTNQKK